MKYHFLGRWRLALWMTSRAIRCIGAMYILCEGSGNVMMEMNNDTTKLHTNE